MNPPFSARCREFVHPQVLVASWVAGDRQAATPRRLFARALNVGTDALLGL
jgi:hypothetical protein